MPFELPVAPPGAGKKHDAELFCGRKSAPAPCACAVLRLNSRPTRPISTPCSRAKWSPAGWIASGSSGSATQAASKRAAQRASPGATPGDTTRTTDRCRSFTRYNEYPFNASLSGLCFGHVDAAWLPLDAPGIDAGTVAWPCATGLDCSLNGKCASGVCTCNTGWTGRRCGTLSLAPARRPRGPWLQPDARRSEHELVGRGRGAGQRHLAPLGVSPLPSLRHLRLSYQQRGRACHLQGPAGSVRRG